MPRKTQTTNTLQLSVDGTSKSVGSIVHTVEVDVQTVNKVTRWGVEGRRVTFSKVGQKAFDNALRKHTLWLSGDPRGERMEYVARDLSKIKFDGLDLSRVVFNGCICRNNAQMRRVNFTGATLTWCNFDGCDMHNSDFTGVDASFTYFGSATMRWCKFIDAKLHRCTFRGDLRWARIEHCDVSDSYWDGVNFWGVDFKKFRYNWLRDNKIIGSWNCWKYRGAPILQYKDCTCCPNYRRWNTLHEDTRGSTVMPTPGH